MVQRDAAEELQHERRLRVRDHERGKRATEHAARERGEREREREERECERLRDREHLQTLAAAYEGLLGMLAAKSAAERDDKDVERRDLEEKVCVCVCVCVCACVCMWVSGSVSECVCMMVPNACQVAHYKGLLERVVEHDILDGGTGRLA